MTIELVIFDLGLQLVQSAASLDVSIEEAFEGTELGKVNEAKLAFAPLRGLREAPGTSAAFAALRSAGIRTALATSCSRGTLAPVLAHLGWKGLVDVVVSAEDATGCSSSAPFVRAAMRQSGVASPARVAKVADTPSGLLEGCSGRCGVIIAVSHPRQEDDDLLLYPHTHRVATASLVPELLRRLARAARCSDVRAH